MSDTLPVTLNEYLSGKELTRQEAHNFRSYVAKKLQPCGKQGRCNKYGYADLNRIYYAWRQKRITAVYAAPYHGADIIGIGSVLIALAALCLITIYILTH